MASSLSILLSGGGLALVRLVTGVVRSKWIATHFGLEGVGMLAQATQFQLVAASASSLSVSAALIQGARGSHKAQAVDLFRTALFLNLLGTGCLLLLVILVGPSTLSHWLFGPGQTGVEFLWVLASIPLLILASAFLEAVFFVEDRFDRYVTNSATHAVLQPLLFIAITIAFGIRGILIAMPAAALLLALIFYGDLVRLRLFDRRWFLPKWDPRLARYLAGHGFAMFVTGVGGGFLLLFVRSTLIARLGLAENGILQVPIALSAYGGAIVTNFIWGRIHPAFSRTVGQREEFDLAFAVVTAFVVALGTWTVAPVMIPLVYSKDFSPAIPFIGIQTTGDVFYFSFFSIAVALLAMGRIRTYVLGWAVYYLPYVLALLLPSLQNVRAIVSLHFVSSALAFSALLIIAGTQRVLPSRAARKLGLLAGSLAASLALLAWLKPTQVGLRFLSGIAVGVAGLLLWRFIYGAVAQEQQLTAARAVARTIQRRLGLDRLLGFLLRKGVLPRRCERFVPQHRDYPAPSLRRVRRDRLTIDLDLSDLPDWKAYFRRRDRKRERIYSFIRPGWTGLDIGCHRGWVSLHLAQAVGLSGRLFACDANPASAAETERRFRLNGFHWAHVRCQAFSDSEKSLTLAPEAERNSASVSVSEGGPGDEIKAIPLDRWLEAEGLKDPDFVKIAINGWEYRTLRGGITFLRRKRPVIFLEIGDANLRRAGSSATELVNWLGSLGYELQPLWGNSETVPTGDALNGCLFDAVALPR